MLFSDYQKDRYCKFIFNPERDGYDRVWIRYSDNTYEPVRRDGDLEAKWTGGRDNLDARAWWVEHKPARWQPWEHGFGFAWNHTLGEDHKPPDWGDKSEAERLAGNAPYFLELETGRSGRVVRRTERIDGRRETWRYKYDREGRLTSCLSATGWAQDYEYDSTGCRNADYAVGRVPFMRVFRQDRRHRLRTVDDTSFEYGKNGLLAVRRGPDGVFRYHYDSEGRMVMAELPDGRLVEYRHDGRGRPELRLVNGDPATILRWRDDGRLAGFGNGRREWMFAYDGEERLPRSAVVDGTGFTLDFDQAGSLKVVANEHGTVVKAVQYDPFGVRMWDSNPGLYLPLGYAGGIDDPDTGLVLFGDRDYDPDTGCWLDGSGQEVFQGPFQLGEAEFIPRVEQPRGQRDLAGEQNLVGHLPEQGTQGEGRGLECGRTVQGFAQDAGEGAEDHRVGGRQVVGAPRALPFHEEPDGPHLVGQVNPGDPLQPRARRTAQVQAEGGQHPGQRASLAQDHAGADDATPDTHLVQGRCGRLPLAADVGQEPGPGRGGFVHGVAVLRAVVADGRGLDHGGGDPFGQPDGAHDTVTRVQAALQDTLLLPSGPTARGNILTRQVDDDAIRAEHVRPVAVVRAHADDPGAEHLGHLAGGAGQDHDLPSVRLELGHQCLAYESGSTGNDRTHESP
eukprot:TRINITY_DN4127_c0_g4_i1.p1 TRINITY_DN4127_c0_g4~~TRINITY_DN4127_c0_g4_i1.p1  ORF type:complete len:677 (+),score=268.79 TRINITY_DN4127_c0_g4_i1:180-2210(+)